MLGYFKEVGTGALSTGFRNWVLLLALFAGQGLSGTAIAQEAEGEWEFQLAPLFLWGMSIDGESAIDGNVAPLELNFKDDLLENINSVLTFHFEARKRNLLLFAEYQYVSVDPSFDASIGSVNVGADIDFTVNTAEMGAGYTLLQSESTRWEVLGGVRWQEHELDVEIDGPAFLPAKIEGGDDWSHGFLGGRVTTSVGKNWSLIARGDYGYGGSDNDAWNLSLIADYRFKGWGSAFIGYRYMQIDYEGSDYSYDAKQQGPQLGVVFHW